MADTWMRDVEASLALRVLQGGLSAVPRVR
ncbi:hypothetical protein COMA2_210013 [Candidatus Nitrospira nitrificans]|uniref:Uncharacterized protein n=1 Tax=Candidatus Nitrospira nitrificans TaxID=1742973 RepID=A0A0S4LF28_9BACT|nr:hypothetical protein COMA2_210013 [Candidatus Nitrospira nitrificans]